MSRNQKRTAPGTKPKRSKQRKNKLRPVRQVFQVHIEGQENIDMCRRSIKIHGDKTGEYSITAWGRSKLLPAAKADCDVEDALEGAVK